MNKRIARATVILGVLIGLVGLSMWSYVVCSIELGGVCFENVRPLAELGLVAMIFGGILFVVGIILLAMSGPPTSLAPPPETPPFQSPPETLEGRHCPECDTLNAFGARFCNSCGSELSQ